jgi:hypothetical protein
LLTPADIAGVVRSIGRRRVYLRLGVSQIATSLF